MTATTSDPLETLDALLAAKPDFNSWRALTEALDAWPADSLEAAVARAEVGLESWPLHLRSCDAWLVAVKEGRDEPRARLVRVTYVSDEDTLDDIAKNLQALPPQIRGLIVHGQAGPEFAKVLVGAGDAVAALTYLRMGLGSKLGTQGAKVLASATNLSAIDDFDLAANDLDDAAIIALSASPLMGGLRRLVLNENAFADAGAEALSEADLSGLRELEVRRCPMTDAGLATLLGSDLSNLERADFAETGFGPAAAAALQPSRLPALRSLGFNRIRTAFGDAAAEAFASAWTTPGLTELDLSVCEIGPEGAKALAGCAGLASVTDLNLAANPFGPKGTKALAQSPHLAPKTLTYTHCEAGARGGASLAGAAWLSGVSTLNLRSNKLGVKGTLALLDSPHLEALRSLNLSDNKLNDKAIPDVIDHPALGRLDELLLEHNSLRKAGIASLAKAKHLRVKKLSLYGNPMASPGTKALDGPVLAHVEELDLRNCTLGDKGIIALVESTPLGALRVLRAGGNDSGAAAGRALCDAAARLPNIQKIELIASYKRFPLSDDELRPYLTTAGGVVRAMLSARRWQRLAQGNTSSAAPQAAPSSTAAPTSTSTLTKPSVLRAAPGAPTLVLPNASVRLTEDTVHAAEAELLLGPGEIADQAWRADGRVTLATNSGVWLWTPRTGGLERISQRSSQKAAVTPDGRWAAATDGAEAVCVIGVDDETEVRVPIPEAKRRFPQAIALAPEGDAVAFMQGSGELVIAALPSGELTFHGQLFLDAFMPPRVEELKFSQNGAELCLVTDAFAGVVRFDRDGTELGRFPGTFRVTRLLHSPDGERLYLASEPSAMRAAGDCFLRVFRRDGTLEREVQTPHSGMYSQLKDIALSPDGTRLYTGGRDQHVHAFDTTTWDRVFLLTEKDLDPLGRKRLRWGQIDTEGLAVSPDAKRLLVRSGRKPTSLQVWDIDAKTRSACQVIAGGQLREASVDRQTGAVAATWWGSDALVWRPGAPSPAYYADKGGPYAEVASVLALCPGATEAVRASGSEAQTRCVRVSLETGEETGTYGGHKDAVADVAQSADGQTVITASDDGTCQVWERGKDKRIKQLTGHSNRVLGVDCSADAGTIATCSADGTFRVWSGKRNRTAAAYPSPGARGAAIAVAVDPAGAWVAGKSFDANVYLFPAVQGALRTIPLPTDGAGQMTFSSDGALLAVGAKGVVYFVRVSDGAVLTTLTGAADCCLAFGPGDRTLVGAGRNGTITVWAVPEGAEVEAPAPMSAAPVVAATSASASTSTPTSAPPSASQRWYLEAPGEKSKKFYELVLDGSTLTTRWGRVGGKPRQSVKTYGSVETAKRNADKRVTEKRGKGYSEA